MSYSHVIMKSCSRDIQISWLAWHHARMLSCSHTRGVIMLLHFPAPTASCPHAPQNLQSLTCKETLPHCLASRSLIVQVLLDHWIPRHARMEGRPTRSRLQTLQGIDVRTVLGMEILPKSGRPLDLCCALAGADLFGADTNTALWAKTFTRPSRCLSSASPLR